MILKSSAAARPVADHVRGEQQCECEQCLAHKPSALESIRLCGHLPDTQHNPAARHFSTSRAFAMLTALDHIALVVRGSRCRDRARIGVARQGADWRGADGGAAHAWFQLSNMALDIIAPIGAGLHGRSGPGASATHAGEGLWAMAFATAGYPEGARDARASRRRSPREAQLDPLHACRVQAASDTGPRRCWIPPSTHGPTILLVEHKTDEPRMVACGTRTLQRPACDRERPRPRRGAARRIRIAQRRSMARACGLEMALDRSNRGVGHATHVLSLRRPDRRNRARPEQGPSDDPDRIWGLSWRVRRYRLQRTRGSQAKDSTSRQYAPAASRAHTCSPFVIGPGTYPRLMIGRDEH